MITYTTLMGFAAGLSMILVAVLGYKLFYKQVKIETFDGWALSFAGLGGMLTLLGAHMSIAWPLQDPEKFKNFMFGEPVLALGVLLLLAAFFLWRRSGMLTALLHGSKSQQRDARNYLFAVIEPVSWIVFGLGLVLAACTIGAFQYEVFATAPAQEPILGTLPKVVTNTALSMLYALPALGCLLVPAAFHLRSRKIMLVSGLLILLTGIGWSVVAVLVYYTHIAMDFNFRM